MPSPPLDEPKLARELTSILCDLIALPTQFPPGDTREICAFTAERLRRAGYETAIHTKAEPYANVIARWGGGSPSVMFNVHADTVSVNNRDDWVSDPLVAEMRDGRIYGPGAANCKASLGLTP